MPNKALAGSTATVYTEAGRARKVYKAEYRDLAVAEARSLEIAWVIGLPVPMLLTVVISEDEEPSEIITQFVEGRTFSELTPLEQRLAVLMVEEIITSIDSLTEEAYEKGLLTLEDLETPLRLELAELLDVEGNIRVDNQGKLWIIDVGC